MRVFIDNKNKTESKNFNKMISDSQNNTGKVYLIIDQSNIA